MIPRSMIKEAASSEPLSGIDASSAESSARASG
jgi:hypothetical protein